MTYDDVQTLATQDEPTPIVVLARLYRASLIFCLSHGPKVARSKEEMHEYFTKISGGFYQTRERIERIRAEDNDHEKKPVP